MVSSHETPATLHGSTDTSLEPQVDEQPNSASSSANESSKKLNPVLFVGGCPRSGTTLLQRMLDHHSQLAMVNDSHFIPRSLERVTTNREYLLELARTGKDIPLGHELKSSVWDYHRFYRMGFERAEFDHLADQASTYQQLVSALFDGFARRSGKTLAGEKTPNYVRRARLLLRMFPQAAFVNIVRDGRDVALSLMDWATRDKGPGRLAYWRVDPVAISALWWSDFVLRGAKYASQFPKNFQTVRYEELLEQPAECLYSICQSAGIDYEPSMLDFHVGKQQADLDASAKKNWLPPTKGLRDWRNAMSEEDITVFNRLAGESLMALGYDMNHDDPSRAAVKRTAKATAWWQAHKSDLLSHR